VQKRARRIKLLLLDVDGVLTDGRVWLQSWPDGSAMEIKGFHSQDGVRLKLARAAGLHTGLITGRESAAVTRRARECEIEFVLQGRAEKIPAFEEILRQSGLKEEETAYVGDDLPDIPVMRRVGLAVAVANAAPEVKKVAHFVTTRAGGDGAISQVVELILKAQGRWADAASRARA
jgi:3-deoxy-D-manno-octulosonate 8-phosphate phosphatase (KDO 8-P phosphatase)